jgi:hypothetical protein
MCAEKFPLVWIGGEDEDQAFEDPQLNARNGTSRNNGTRNVTHSLCSPLHILCKPQKVQMSYNIYNKKLIKVVGFSPIHFKTIVG